jgi:5,10-methenyltetrahydrofolate synthetase
MLPEDCQIIGYQALPGEIGCNEILPFLKNDSKISFSISQDKNSDPFATAETTAKIFSDKPVAVLVPGTAFDTYGNRIGRGGGWYDRFLSGVPKTWIKIGVCYKTQLLKTRIDAKQWDQSMNRLVVMDSDTRKIETLLF